MIHTFQFSSLTISLCEYYVCSFSVKFSLLLGNQQRRGSCQFRNQWSFGHCWPAHSIQDHEPTLWRSALWRICCSSSTFPLKVEESHREDPHQTKLLQTTEKNTFDVRDLTVHAFMCSTVSVTETAAS